MDVAVVVVTLLAPALGGSTESWARAVITMLAGALVLVSPPDHRLPLRLNFIFAALLILSLVPLLPAHWLPALPWRSQLLGEFGLLLSRTWSLQPWLTVEGALLLFVGLVWAGFLLTRRWHLRRRQLVEIYCGGVFLLNAAALALYFTGEQFPLWRIEAGNFGFFPHRNQTANFLALGGIMTLALALECFRKKRKSAAVWAGSFLLIGVALMVNYSRAGILIYFLGSLVWIVWASRFAHGNIGLGLGLASLFFFLTLFVLFGGETLQRFRPKQDTHLSPVLDFRILLQQDALALVPAASWHGFGLGSFEPIFARQRVLSTSEIRAHHPDSDWLWLGLEMGVLAPLLVFAAVVILLRQCWPFGSGSERRLRSAATLCVALFVAHGYVDVSAHRVGTLWPAIFLLGLARNHAFDPRLTIRKMWAFRALGLGLATLGLIWLAASFGKLSVPTTGALAWHKSRITSATQRGQYGDAIHHATQGLRIAPLDWQLYFSRAAAGVMDSPDDPLAIRDFARARHLEPSAAALPLDEGLTWLGRNAAQTEAAWAEALRRSPRNATGLYDQMLLAAWRRPEIRDPLWRLTGSDARLKLMFFRIAERPEFTEKLGDLLASDPSLRIFTPGQLRELFLIWAAKGDRTSLERHLEASPKWLDVGGDWLAEFEAGQRKFQRACEIARRQWPAPALPPLTVTRSLAQLEREFQLRPQDIPAGIALYAGQIKAQQPEAALTTLRQLLGLPKCPAYVGYLEAELLAKLGRWEEAWTAWKRYASLREK
jgi:tetratricopeptide (TPR) repeat protein